MTIGIMGLHPILNFDFGIMLVFEIVITGLLLYRITIGALLLHVTEKNQEGNDTKLQATYLNPSFLRIC